jgi:hypothetical protein
LTSRSRRRQAWLLLVLPLAVASGAAVIAYASSDDSSPRLASGASGGALHPIAGSFRPDGRVLGECGEDHSCIQQAFGNIAYRQGVKRALLLFEHELARRASVKQDCHRIVHTIGAAALERFRGDVARTFAAGSATCASGYYHGVLERSFVGVKTRAGLVDVARSLCVADTIRPRGFLDYQCRHGLGHGLMIQGGYDLPLALETCERLQTGWDAVACYGGAFMENATTLWGYRSRWLDEEDPLSPCEEIAERHRRWCYLRAPTRIVAFERQDVRAVARTCASLPAEYAEPCLRGLGREVANESDYAPKRIVELCGRVGVGTDLCFYGAARTIGERAALSGPRSAARLCAVAPASRRDACFGGVGIAVGLRYPTDVARRRACAKLAGTSADACSAKAIAAVDATGRAAWG